MESMKYFYCEQCLYKTVRKHNLKRHMLKMHTVSRRVLECCGIVFQTKSHFRDHLSTFHKDGYNCSICQRLFQRKALLMRHLSVHGGRKEFRCSTCNYETSHKSNLYRHKKVHLKNKTASYSKNKRLENRSHFIDRAMCHSVENIPFEVFKHSANLFSNRENLNCDLQTPGRFPWYCGSTNALHCPSMVLSPYQIPTYPIIRDNYLRNTENVRPFPEFIPASDIFYPFRGNEMICSACNSDVGENHFYVGLENRRRLTNQSTDELNKNTGEEIEVTSTVREKPIRLCDFPYKCNFCNSRFGSQNELSHHFTRCDINI